MASLVKSRDPVPFFNRYLNATLYADDVVGRLIDALETSRTKREPRPRRKHGNIPL